MPALIAIFAAAALLAAPAPAQTKNDQNTASGKAGVGVNAGESEAPDGGAKAAAKARVPSCAPDDKACEPGVGASGKAGADIGRRPRARRQSRRRSQDRRRHALAQQPVHRLA